MTEITTVAQQNMLRAITRVLLAHSWNVDNGCDAGCSGIGTAEGWRHHIAVALLTEINPAHPTVQPSVEAVAHAIYDCTDLNRAVLEDAREIAEAVLALIGGRTEAEVLAQGWDEGRRAVVNAHPSWWSTLRNPYRSEANRG